MIRSKAGSPSSSDGRRWRRQRSLFGEILNWLLAPLFLLWPLAITLTYFGAEESANAPYDRALASVLLMLAQQVHVDANGKPILILAPSTEALLRGDETDSMFYLVLADQTEILGGDRELPLPPNLTRPLPGVIQYRDATVRGFPVRIAYTWLDLRSSTGSTNTQPVLVQVAETLEKRAQLANHIVRSVVIPQLVILPLAVLMVWFGLKRGIRPLSTLQARLRARRPDDLSPMSTREVPRELLPLVRAMNELLARLQANIETQRRFVADAAHQLKTPLAGLRTQAELALRTSSREDLEASLHHLIASSDRAARVVNQMLVLARTESEHAPQNSMAVVDLHAIARDCTLDRVNDAIARGIDLGLESDDEPIHIWGHALLLGELISNLVDNALRYTPGGGTVTVRVHREGQTAVLQVDDSGPGIPEADRERVFDRFYRVLGTSTEGSGLGLAIVREIAQRHGAQVRLGDNPTVLDPESPGVRVTVTFPLHQNGPSPNGIS